MIPTIRNSPEEASQECEYHWLGIEGSEYITKHDLEDMRAELGPDWRPSVFFRYCPICGARLLPEAKPKTCECGNVIDEDKFYAEFPKNSGKYLCNKCCFLACERADAIRAPRDTGFVTPSGFDSH